MLTPQLLSHGNGLGTDQWLMSAQATSCAVRLSGGIVRAPYGSKRAGAVALHVVGGGVAGAPHAYVLHGMIESLV
jgi:hypothetical protein